MISVIRPTYNRASNLRTVAESVLKEHPQEIIVVNNCSTDNSREMMSKYNLHFIGTPVNSGASISRNFGFSYSDGDIITFIDDDVEILQGTLDKISDNLKKYDVVIGMPTFESVYSNLCSKHFNWRIHYNYMKLDNPVNFIYGSLFGIKREKFTGFSTDRSTDGIEDNELGHNIVGAGGTIFLDKSLQFRHHKKINLLGLLKNHLRCASCSL